MQKLHKGTLTFIFAKMQRLVSPVDFRYGIANDKQIGVFRISLTVEYPSYRSSDKFLSRLRIEDAAVPTTFAIVISFVRYSPRRS